MILTYAEVGHAKSATFTVNQHSHESVEVLDNMSITEK